MNNVHKIKNSFIENFKNNNNINLSIKYEFNPSILELCLLNIGNDYSFFNIHSHKDGKLCFNIVNLGDKSYNFSLPSVLNSMNKNTLLYNNITLSFNNNVCNIFANGRCVFIISGGAFDEIISIVKLKNINFNLSSFCDYSVNTNNIVNKINNNNTIFYAGDNTNTNYFRIPALYTLNNGSLVSSIDARYGGTHDSMSKINISFSKSIDNGKTWSNPSLPFQFLDYINERIEWARYGAIKDAQISNSASFIDSVLLQDDTSNRLFLFTDAMPFGIGAPNTNIGTGFKYIDNKKYLKLHHIDDNKDEYNYSIRDDNCIYNDISDEKTIYSIDGNFNLLNNSNYVYQKQYCIKFDNDNILEEKTDIDVKTNVFYKDCPFKLFPTNYIAMRYSDDNGETWSDMNILDIGLDPAENNPLFAPGRGIQLKYGKYKNRLLLNAYFPKTGKFCNISSDDNGKTFSYEYIDITEDVIFSEAQTVELLDGTIVICSRTNKGKIGFIISTNNGDTYSDVKFIDNIYTPNYGTQVSIIKYSKLIDDKEAIIISTPTSKTARKNGKIFIALFNKDTLSLDLKYSYSIDIPEYGFSYSCLSELENGDIGLFYEKFDSWSRDELHLKDVLKFESYTLEKLCANKI